MHQVSQLKLKLLHLLLICSIWFHKMLLHSLNLQLVCSQGSISTNRQHRLHNHSYLQLNNSQLNSHSNLRRNKMLLAYHPSHLTSNQGHSCRKDNRVISCHHNNNSHQQKMSLILAKLSPNQPMIHSLNQNSNQKNKSLKNSLNTSPVKESSVRMMHGQKEPL